MRFIFTYETKNLINGKTYIGVHSTNDLKDGYMGSGKLLKIAMKKYGKENFSCVPLSFFENIKEAYEEERFLVDEFYVKSERTYNLCLGGEGGYKGGMKGKKHKKSTINLMREKSRGEGNSRWKGVWVTPFGEFIISRDAAKACSISSGELKRRCMGRRYKYRNGERETIYSTFDGYSFRKKSGS